MLAAVGVALLGGDGIEIGETAGAVGSGRKATAASLNSKIHKPPQSGRSGRQSQLELHLLERGITRCGELVLIDVAAFGEGGRRTSVPRGCAGHHRVFIEQIVQFHSQEGDSAIGRRTVCLGIDRRDYDCIILLHLANLLRPVTAEGAVTAEGGQAVV